MLSPGDGIQGLSVVRCMRASALCETYQVKDAQGGPAILKIYAPEAFDDVAAAELLAGVSRLAKRRTPRVALPRALGVWPVGAGERLCMLRDYAPGPTLAELLAAKPRWSTDDIVVLARSLLGILVGLSRDALAALALKPENIAGPPGAEVLLDAGIRLVDPECASGLSFLAPEQLEGKSGDQASDQYALGVLLFRLMAGRPPHEGTSAAAVLASIRSGEKPPLVGDLAPLIGRLLAQEPARRFQDVSQVAAKLPQPATATDPRELAAAVPEAPSMPQAGAPGSAAQAGRAAPDGAVAAGKGPAGKGAAAPSGGTSAPAVDWKRIQKMVSQKKKERTEIPYGSTAEVPGAASGDAGAASGGASAGAATRGAGGHNDQESAPGRERPGGGAPSRDSRAPGGRAGADAHEHTGDGERADEGAGKAAGKAGPRKYRTLSTDEDEGGRPGHDGQGGQGGQEGQRGEDGEDGEDGEAGGAGRSAAARAAQKTGSTGRRGGAWLVPVVIAVLSLVGGLVAFLKQSPPGRGGRATPTTIWAAASPAEDAPPSAAVNVEDVVALPSGEATISMPTGETRKVALGGGSIDRTEVTNEMFAAFVKNAPYKAQGNWRRYDSPGRENHPVRGVTWNDAVAYARWVKKRLPTSDEWEAAARGSSDSVYPWGNDFDATRCQGGGGQKDTAPVGSFSAGAAPSGAMDMAGNVWEWTSDRDGDSAILRGGSYRSSAADLSISNARLTFPANTSDEDIGFRCYKPEK